MISRYFAGMFIRIMITSEVKYLGKQRHNSDQVTNCSKQTKDQTQRDGEWGK